MSGKDTRTLDLSAALADTEQGQLAARIKRVNETGKAIETLLGESGVTWDEWGEIIDGINRIFANATGRMTVKEISELHDRPNTRSADDGGTEGSAGQDESGRDSDSTPPSSGTEGA